MTPVTVAPAEERCLAATRADGGPWEAFACGIAAEPGRLTGWWAPPGPGVLENPYSDQSVVEELERHVWDVVVRLTPRLGTRLGELTGLDRAPEYWETLIQPWLVHVVSAVCDRRLALLAATRIAPEFAVEGTRPFDPPADADQSIRLLYTSTGNQAVIPMVAEPMDQPVLFKTGEPASHRRPHTRQPLEVGSRSSGDSRAPRAWPPVRSSERSWLPRPDARSRSLG